MIAKSGMFTIVLVVALIVATTATAAKSDPRVCSLAATGAACATDAAELQLRRTITADLRTKILWNAANISCAPKNARLLSFRCTWLATPTPAATVRWDSVSFKPTVTLGPVAVAFVEAVRAKLAASR